MIYPVSHLYNLSYGLALLIIFDFFELKRTTSLTCIYWLQKSLYDIWAATCDLQQCGILTSVDSDEPLQPSFKLRYSKWCSVGSLTVKEYLSDKQRLWSVCVYAHAGLSLCWIHVYHIVGNLMSLLICLQSLKHVILRSIVLGWYIGENFVIRVQVSESLLCLLYFI